MTIEAVLVLVLGFVLAYFLFEAELRKRRDEESNPTVEMLEALRRIYEGNGR